MAAKKINKSKVEKIKKPKLDAETKSRLEEIESMLTEALEFISDAFYQMEKVVEEGQITKEGVLERLKSYSSEYYWNEIVSMAERTLYNRISREQYVSILIGFIQDLDAEQLGKLYDLASNLRSKRAAA